MNIAIFAGEVSGDLIGGALAQELRRMAPDATLWGLGSQSMRAAGVDLVADSAEWSAIGIVESIGKVPDLLLRISPLVKRKLREIRPDVVVLIDFGFFNIQAAEFAKKLGLKVCYYFPPGAWRRSGSANPQLGRITDLVATPFEWSVQRYQDIGARVEYVGHPLLERVKAQMTREEFATQFGMDASKPIIGLMPGSRKQEVSHLMPTLLDTARRIYQEVPDAQFVVAVAPSISPDMMINYLRGHADLRDKLHEIWHEFVQEAETKVWKPVARTASKLAPPGKPVLVTTGGVLVPEESWREEQEARYRSQLLRSRAEKTPPPTVLAKGLTYDVMAHSDVLLVCSGTATLEATLFGTPMVILYRGSRLLEIEYHLRGIRKKVPFIGLPNILAGRKVLPELLQQDANPEAIAAEALPMLNDLQTRQRIRTDLQAVRALLGTVGASARTAQLVLDLARRA